MTDPHTIICGSAGPELARMCKSQVHLGRYRLVVTSPPYFQHRSYGTDNSEIGREDTADRYLDNLVDVFAKCKRLLTPDGSLFIVIGDTRRNRAKLMIPHRLALRLVECGYMLQEDIIWYKKNAVSSSSKTSLTQSYEPVLFMSNGARPFINIDAIRVQGNEVLSGDTRRTPPTHLIQDATMGRDEHAIREITEKIHGSTPETPLSELPSTSEISRAHGYDPEKYCPTCHRKFKRHATRKRFGGHRHYPIFAVCNPRGKNPGNVWEISTKAHHGNEHFAVFPEDLISRIVKLATLEGDHILDPFAGRGTVGIVSACLKRRFTGIELYRSNTDTISRNISDAVEGRLSAKILNQII